MKPRLFLSSLFNLEEHPDRIRIILVIALLVFVAVAAPLVAQEQTIAIGLIALVPATLGLVVLFRYPGLGFPLLIVAALLIPFAISTGTQTRLNAALLLLAALIGIWIIQEMTSHRKGEKFRTATTLPAVLMLISALISFGFGQMPWYSGRSASFFAQLGGLFIFMFSVGGFLLAAHRFNHIRWLKWTVGIFIVLAAIYNLAFLLPPLRPYANRIFQRAVVDSMFWTMLVVMAFSQAILNTDLKKWIRWALGIITALALLNLLVIKQSWVSGWAPAVAGLLVVIFLYKPRLVIPAGFVVAALFIIQSQLLESFVMTGDNEYSLTTRLEAYKILLQIISRSPVFGLGPANYYWYTPNYSILGYSVQFNSHNNYLDILAQTGIVGLICFFWLFITIGETAFKLRKSASGGFSRAFITGIIGGLFGALVAAMLGDWIIPFVYNVGMEGTRASLLVWLFMGGVVFLDKLQQQTGKTE